MIFSREAQPHSLPHSLAPHLPPTLTLCPGPEPQRGGCDSKEPVCLNSKWKLTVLFSFLCYFWLVGKEGWKVEAGGSPLGYLNIIWPWLIGEARKPSNTLSAQIMGRADQKRSIFSGNWDWVPRSLLSACPGLALGPPHWLPVFPWAHSSCRRHKGGAGSLAHFVKWGKIQRKDSRLYCKDLGLLTFSVSGSEPPALHMRAQLPSIFPGLLGVYRLWENWTILCFHPGDPREVIVLTVIIFLNSLLNDTSIEEILVLSVCQTGFLFLL